MNVAEIKDHIAGILKKPHLAVIYYVLEKRNGPNNKSYCVRKADISGDAQAELTEMFSEKLKTTVVEQANLQIASLASGDGATSESIIYRYDLHLGLQDEKDAPAQLTLFKDFTEEGDIPMFSGLEKDEKVYGFIISVGNDQKCVQLFKLNKSIFYIKKRPGLFILQDAVRLEQYKGHDLYAFNDVFQLFKIDQEIFVMDHARQSFAGLWKSMIHKRANAVIAQVSARGLLLNPEEMMRAADNNDTFARQLSTALDSPILKLDSETIMSGVRQHLGSRFTITDDKLVFVNSLKTKNAFADLLNDAHTRSLITNQHYIVGLKKPLDPTADAPLDVPPPV